jgi:hypothetical protein
MKKLILAIAIIITPIISFGQGLFDKYEDMDGVASVVVNQKMFGMLADMSINVEDNDAQEMIDFVGNITGLKVLTTGDESISASMNADVKRYLSSANLEELMRIKDGGQTVKFYVKEGRDDNHVKELLMIVNGLKEMTNCKDITINGKKRDLETVVLSLTGDIDLRKVARFTEKMNVPGGKHLKKAGKKNKK